MDILLAPLWLLGALVNWTFETIGTLLPVFGVAICVIAAGMAVLVVIAMILGIRVPGLLRAKRTWVRVIGWVLVAGGCVLFVGFVALSIIAGAAVAILS